MEVEKEWAGKIAYPYFTQGYLISVKDVSSRWVEGMMFGIDTLH
jgi:hypothetical protein